jgi:S1-C subfamily serine protease
MSFSVRMRDEAVFMLLPKVFRFAFLCLMSLAMFFLTAASAFSQHQHQRRTWTAADGAYTIEATMVDGTGKSVFLKTDDKPRLKVSLDKLSPQDQLYAKGWMIVDREQEQYDLVLPHLERYRESPLAVVEILHAIHRRIPEAPYASCMIGMAYASGKGDYSQAEKYFKYAAGSIEKGQAVLGNQFHALTETAVRNNLAVCACKVGNGDKATKLIRGGSDTQHALRFCLYHNATLLLEAEKFEFSNIRLSKGARRRLVDFLAQKPPANPEFSVPSLFLYLLEWDAPVSEAEFESVLAGKPLASGDSNKTTAVSGKVFQTEKQLRDRGFVEFSQGTGFLIDENLVVTNRHVVKSVSNDLSYTITQFESDGMPKLVGGSIVEMSPVLEQDLAMIKLEQSVSAKPLPIDATEIVKDDEVTVVGFPDTATNGEHISASLGFVEKVDLELPWVYLSAKLQSGSSGSPCVDKAGNVLGVAFARTALPSVYLSKRYGHDSIAVDNTSLIEFIKSVKPDFKPQKLNSRAFPNDIEMCQKIRESVFLIKSWMPPTTKVKKKQLASSEKLSLESNSTQLGGTAKSRELEIATLKENRLYPDVWCPYCAGAATLPCPRRLCRRGVIEQRKTVLAGHHPTSGDPIYRTERIYVDCPTCSGKNHLKCPYCDDGVLK